MYASGFAFGLFHGLVFELEELPLGIHQYDLKIEQALKHAKVGLSSILRYRFNYGVFG